MPGQPPTTTELNEVGSDHSSPSAEPDTPPRNRRRVVFAAASAIIGVLLSLVIIETGLRLITPDWLAMRMRELNAGDQSSFGTDQDWPSIRENGVFLQFPPGSTMMVRHDEYEHAATIDDLGGRATPYPADHSTLIPVMGDSFTFGVGVQDSETFLALIASEFPARLANFGVPGSGLHDQLNIVEWRHQSLGAPPAYVFVLFMGNDLTNIRDRHERADAVRTGLDVGGEGDWLWRANNFVVHHPTLKQLYFIQFFRRHAQQWLFSDRTDFMRPVILAMRTDSSYLEDSLVYFRMELERLAAMSRKIGFRFAFVLLPDVHQLDDSRRSGKAMSIGLTDEQLDPDRPTLAIRAALDDFDIRYADLTGCLKSGFEDDLFFIRDNHFTAAGHARAASCLLQSGLFESFFEE